MIVREQGEDFICIYQHDHALLAGELASHYNGTIFPYSSTLYGIAFHDIGWKAYDLKLAWNEEKDRPYTFEDTPLEEKLTLYRNGIDQVEAIYPYAGFLCSKHYCGFFANDFSELAVRFREQESIRQHQLRQFFTKEEERQIQKNYRLLRFFDDLSLALCLNEPQKKDHPWFADGILFNEKKYQWKWLDEKRLYVDPEIFTRDFQVELPYIIVGRDRRIKKKGKYTWSMKIHK